MKKLLRLLTSFLIFTLFSIQNYGQVDLATFVPKEGQLYIVEKNDGYEFVGKILSFDARELLIITESKGQIIIPKHEIKKIKALSDDQLDTNSDYLNKETFSTRYFITTNGLPIERGEHYTQWNLFGPDFQFAVRDNFGLGIMTSWFAIPIIGTAKYTINLGKNTNMALGALVGTYSWVSMNSGLALPYVSLTFGDRRSNLTFSGGYGAIFIEGDSEGRVLASIAGMTKVSENFSLVFDSFLVPGIGKEQEAWGLVVPGVRWQNSPKQAFQFGFAGMYGGGELVPFPIPMLQWYRKIN